MEIYKTLYLMTNLLLLKNEILVLDTEIRHLKRVHYTKDDEFYKAVEELNYCYKCKAKYNGTHPNTLVSIIKSYCM